MPYSNPITISELSDITFSNPLHPRDGSPDEVYMPQAYFMVPPATTSGPVKWRLFDAAYISTGIIDPNRLGTGSTGLGNLYLADDGTWKPVGGGGGGDMLKATYDVDNDGVVDSAERIEIIVRNSTGSTLTKGQVVYLSGATGNRPNAVLSQANTEATSSKTIGIVVSNISNNSDGYVATNGTLHDLDTSAFAAGDALWLSATVAGAMTSTIPAEPNHTVFIGYVARAHPTQGRLVILIQNGYELNELHGVLVTSEANNDLLVYETSTTLWKNKSISTIFGGTPLVSVPTLDQVTTAGNTTTNSITVGGLTTTGQVLFNAYGAYNTGTPTLRIENVDTNNVAIQIKGNVANYKYYWIYDSVKGEGIYKSDQGRIDLIGGTNIGFGFVNNYGRLFTIGGVTGNILINTTTDAGYKLDVNGTSIFRGDLSTASGKNMLFGTTLPSRHTNSAAYPGVFIGNSNSSVMGETGSGYKGINMMANIVRDTSLYWVHQDTTQPGWIMGLNYETANTDMFAIYRSAATASSANFVVLFTVKGTGNVLINTTTDSGQKLQVSGKVFIKGTTSLTATKVFEVQNGAGESIMDFRDNQYAFFGCGQGGGSATGFIFNYSNTSYCQFSGYNYGAGSGAYKPILLDTDIVGRGNGVFVNFGVSTNPPPDSDTEFGVRGRTADSSTYIARFRNSTNLDKFEIRADGALFTNTLQGYSGTLTIPGNPPGSTTITITNGLITNIA